MRGEFVFTKYACLSDWNLNVTFLPLVVEIIPYNCINSGIKQDITSPISTPQVKQTQILKTK